VSAEELADLNYRAAKAARDRGLDWERLGPALRLGADAWAGVLRGLVREAWESPSAYVDPHGPRPRVFAFVDGEFWGVVAEAPSEAAALVAALEAAP
jgi:hypothetical protein